MARARNYLLSTELEKDVDYVLWLDNDVSSYPRNMIQILIAARKSIVAASCVEQSNHNRTYDLNSWRRPKIGKKLFPGSDPEDVHFAGYLYDALDGKRLSLKEAAGVPDRETVRVDGAEYTLVQLEAVGGRALLVSADLHRSGVVFPHFPIDNLIETEGLSRSALRMGATSWGFTNVDAVHP